MEILGKLSTVSEKEWRFFRNVTPNQIISVLKETPINGIVLQPGQAVALTDVEVHMNADRKPFQEQRISEITNEIPGYGKGQKNYKTHLPVSSQRTGATWDELKAWLESDGEAAILEKAKGLKSLIMFDKLIDLCKDQRKSWVLIRDLEEVRKGIAKKLKEAEENK